MAVTVVAVALATTKASGRGGKICSAAAAKALCSGDGVLTRVLQGGSLAVAVAAAATTTKVHEYLILYT